MNIDYEKEVRKVYPDAKLMEHSIEGYYVVSKDNSFIGYGLNKTDAWYSSYYNQIQNRKNEKQ